MKRIQQILTVLLIAGFTAHAQKYKLGDVTENELAEKEHPADPSATAAILFSKGETYMSYSPAIGDFELVTEVDVKIKIYKKDGYEWANKAIKFYSSDTDKESVSVSKAATYNLVNGKIEKTKLKNEGEFTEELNKYWKVKKIVMPDVKEGCIVEYRYSIRSPFIHTFPEWRFQESVPVNHSEYTTKIPEYYMFNPNFRGFYAPTVTTDKVTRSLNITSKERTGVYISKTTYSNNKIDYQETQTTYELDNLPALKEEAYVDNIDNYSSSIEHELSVISFPSSPVKTVSTTWEDVAKSIYKFDSFGPELNKTGYYDDDIDALIAGATSPQEKAIKIFFYVKNRMNWNGFTGYGCEEGVRRAYKEKVGNSADINLMLTSMLRYSGLEANPVLVSTRSNKIALFPSRTAFNYVIAAVNINGENILFDATSKDAMPDILPVRAINWLGYMIKNDGSAIPVDLAPTTTSREIVMVSASMDAEGTVSGTARDQYFDYNAFMFRNNYGGLKNESYIEKLEKQYSGIQIDGCEIKNDDPFKPVLEEYNFKHNGLTDVIGDKIYFSPMLFFTQSENPFKQEKREYPINFIFPHEDRYMITMSIPEGYEVESLPEPVAVAMEKNIGSFRYNIGQSNNQLQLVASVNINYATIPQDYYATVKNFFQQMIEKQREKIILKKSL